MVSFITIIDREIAAMSDKKFKVSAEKFGIVTVNLESRSWINSQDSHFDLYWSNLSQTDFQSVIVNEAIVNHFRGSQNLSNKALLAYHCKASKNEDRVSMPLQWSAAYDNLYQLIGIVLTNTFYCLIKKLASDSNVNDDTQTKYQQQKSELTSIYNLLNVDSEWRLSAISVIIKEMIEALNTYDDNCDHIHGCINNNDSMIEKKIFLQNYITKFEISEYGIYTLYGGDSNIWIIKPVGLSCGKKISCVSGLYHLLTVLKTMNYKCVIQKYIERPLLLRNKKKFDIRQWILITSVDPLIVYGYSECYIRLSVREFSLDEEKLIDPTIHLCNHAIQKHAIVTPSLLSSLSSSSSSSSMSSSSTIFPSIPIKDYQATHQHVKHNNTSNNQDDNSNPTTVTLINNEQEIVIKHDNNDNDHDDLPYCESMMSQSEFQKCLNEGYYKKKVITNSLSLEKKTTIPDNDENTNYSNKSNDNRYKKFDVYKTFILPQIKKIVIASIESVRDKLQRIGKGFEWLGLDLMVVESDNDNENYDDDDIEINIPHSMIDSNNNTDNQNGICQHGDNNENKRNEKEYNPYTVLLLEINVSPDISLSTPITTRLVPPAVTDLFDLLLDRKAADNPIEAAKMADNEINGVDSVNNLEESDTNKGQNNSGGISREERNINNNINTSSYSSSSCSSNSSSSNSGGNSNSNSNGVSVNSNNTHTNSKSSGKLKWDLWHIGPLRGKRELLSFGRKKQEYLSLGAIGDYEPRKVEIIDKVFQILEYNRKKNDIPVDVLMKESVLCALPTTVQVINTNQSSTDSQVVANNTIPDVLMNTNNDQEVDEDEI